MGLGYLDPANRREPGGLQAKLLAECPVHVVDEHDPPFYVVAPDRTVRAVLRDTSTFPSEMGPGVEYTPGGVLGSTDRPAHTRQRRVLAQAFTPSAMAALEPSIALIAADMLDQFVPAGRGDFVELFAGPFPAIVIAELLGVPAEDRGRFRAWSDTIVTGLGGEDLDEQAAVRREMHAYLGGWIDERLDALEAATRPCARRPGARHRRVRRRALAHVRRRPRPRPPQPQRDDPARHADAGGRARDHDVPAGPDDGSPDRAARAGRARPGRPLAHRAPPRRGAPVRLPRPGPLPHHVPRGRGARHDDPRGRQGAGAVRGSEPGPAALGGSRRVPHRAPPARRPARPRRLRPRHPRLHRGAAGPHGGPHRRRPDLRPHDGPGPRRRTSRWSGPSSCAASARYRSAGRPCLADPPDLARLGRKESG